MQISGSGVNKGANEPQHVRKWTLVLAKEVIPRPKATLICITIPLNTHSPKFVMRL